MKRNRQLIDRNEAWWAAWELAHSATCLYEAYARDVDRETAIAALGGNKFPDEQTLRWRLMMASRNGHDEKVCPYCLGALNRDGSCAASCIGVGDG